ncbi:DUF1345 domain-containing protein [Herbiconiux sp. P18]|uniref:DUF1345 domain-containing protein n=1 Tax=Herbiconiux liangxiaofengii TaxID=3342795 RepID=UPI0035B7DB24
MDAARPSSRDWATTAAEVVMVVVSVVYVVTSSFAVLAVWEVIAAAYLVVGYAGIRRRTLAGQADTGRSGVLDTLSWVLPLAASLVGINSAVLFLLGRSDLAGDPGAGAVTAISAALGIVISWLLLHTGFAQRYETIESRSTGEPGLIIPSRPHPGLVDYLYFSFTIGSSFATSDVTVNTSRMRLTVLMHSVVSFFYNALVVALAFQILQQLGAP